jgi:EAL domain-containing protein (putative c-di-GMP-specific phosphodiesterase class I)
LGERVLRRACADAATWPAHIKVAVNLSPLQFRTGRLVETIMAALADSGLPATRLELEITESVLLQKNAANLSTLHELRSLGVSIVLDDFGTGYSSLSYLRMFPFDKIKIDRVFVQELASRSDCAAIVCAITGLARSLSIVTTAEGVETEEQLALVRAAGCNQVQGYLFGRPGPAHGLPWAPAVPRRA